MLIPSVRQMTFANSQKVGIICLVATALSNGSDLSAQEESYGYDWNMSMQVNPYFYHNAANEVVQQVVNNPSQLISGKGLNTNKLLELRDTLLQSTVVDGIRSDATINVDAFASVKVWNGRLSGYYDGNITANGFVRVDPNDPNRNIVFFDPQVHLPNITTNIHVGYNDKITLLYHGHGPIPSVFFGGVDARWNLDVSIKGTLRPMDGALGGDNYIGGFSKADFSVGSSSLGVQIDPFDPELRSLTYQYLVQHYTPDSNFSFGVKAGTDQFGSLRYGSLVVDWRHTFAFEGLYFSDGSTPESHGFEVILASGLPSPNLVPKDGDFNGDLIVDAADYVVWRKQGGTADDYDKWRYHYGHSWTNGTGASSSVPEPSSVFLLAITAISLLGRRKRC